MAKTDAGKNYQVFNYDMPLNRMAALVCTYQGRPLASTLFTTSMFAKVCTNAGMCVDCIYEPNDFKVNAYYNDGKLYLLADDPACSAVFIVF